MIVHFFLDIVSFSISSNLSIIFDEKKNTYNDDKTLTKKTGDICLENFENP